MSSTRKQKRQNKSVITKTPTNSLPSFPREIRSIRSITSEVLAEDDVNADKTKDVGGKILSSMVGKNVHNHSFSGIKSEYLR